VHGPLIDAVLDAWAGRRRAAPPSRQLAEPLSEREQTVLRYLASSRTNADIAAELFVTPNTVKTHVRSIYRKLGVGRRHDAVLRARELQLLSTPV
jgi:LuxR family maltose regulon positive regulatory protein